MKNRKILIITLVIALATATVLCLGACSSVSTAPDGSGNNGSSNDGNNAYVPVELKLEYRQVAGGVEIYGVGKESLKTDLVIPATIDTYPVVGIAEKAFQGFSNLISVTFEEGCRVKYIGNCAFDQCSSLENFVVPNTVESLGEYAFGSCPKLEYLFIPSSVQTAARYIVRGCDTEKLDVLCGSSSKPNGWDSYYASNKNYDSGKHFEFWWGIERLEMSEPNLECCVNYDGELILTDYYGLDANVVLPESVAGLPIKHIYKGAFANNANMRSITLPSGLKTLGNEVFYNCAALKSVTIPNGVSSLGNRVFQSCGELVYVTIPNSVDTVGEFLFYSCDKTKLDVYCEIPTKPSGWSSYYASNNTNNSETYFNIWWGTGAVEYSNENYKMGIKNDGTLILTHYLGKESSVTIPREINGRVVSEIGTEGFYECSTVQSVYIPDGGTTIGSYAFYKCISLSTISIPNNVTSIGKRAFANCSALTYVYIPASVVTLGDFVFISCNTNNLHIYCEAESKPSTWSSYYGSNNTNSSGVHFTFHWGA